MNTGWPCVPSNTIFERRPQSSSLQAKTVLTSPQVVMAAMTVSSVPAQVSAAYRPVAGGTKRA